VELEEQSVGAAGASWVAVWAVVWAAALGMVSEGL